MRSLLTTTALVLLAVLPLAHPAVAQAPEVVADGLVTPLGVTIDDEGRVWVAESGSGDNDGRVSILIDGTLTPVVTGFPSTGSPGGEVDGVSNILPLGDDVWMVGGGGAVPTFDLLRFSASQFTPGATLTPADAQEQYNLSAWVLAEGFAESNIFDAAPGPDGSLILTDAAANALIRLDAGATTPTLVTTFDPVDTGGVPPTADPVPTGVLRDGDDYLVGTLTGFPFSQGVARVYRVTLDGTVTTPYTDLTMVNDLVHDPRDGRPVAIEFAGAFELPGGFVPGTSRVVKLFADGTQEVLADGLSLTPGLAFDDDGTLYVTSLFGELLRITLPPVSVEDDASPSAFTVGAPWPNPFVETAVVPFALAAGSEVEVDVFDLLGRRVRGVASRTYPEGSHEVEVDGTGLAPGLYVVRLTTGSQSHTRRLVRTR